MEQTQELFLDKIDLPKDNMREHIDRDSIFELTEDIKKNGLIQPITVRPKDGRYELVAGQRRYLAHQYGGIYKIKCIVRELNDEEAFAIMTSENLSRVDVNLVDEAKHIGRLVQMKDGDIKSVAQLVGRGEQWVRDRLAVSEMPDYMQEYLANKEIPLGVALILNEITDEQTKRLWTAQAVRDGASIAMARYWLYDFQRQLLPGGILSDTPPNDFTPNEPTRVMFTCAIDGQKYDAELFRTVMIYKENMKYFNEFVSALNDSPAEN